MGAASAHYDEALGLLEVLGGVLVLCRKTDTIRAGIIAAVLTNVVLANFAYQLGDHVYASSLLLIAVFLLAHDLPRLFDLLFLERMAKAERYEPVFANKQVRTARVLLK